MENEAVAATGDDSEVKVLDGAAENAEPVNQEAEKPEGAQEKDDFEPFPKKARNAISRRDKEIAKLRAQIRELANTQQAQPAPQKDGAPDPNKFETYAEYLEAKTLYVMEQKLREQAEAGQKAAQQRTGDEARQQYVLQKQTAIAQKVQEYVKAIPDFQEVVNESSEILDLLPPHVKEAFYEADDAAMAFYNLAKEGRLDELQNASPVRAAMIIAQAQQGNLAQFKSNAPRPMRGATGKGRPGKSLADMSEDELVKKFIK